MPHNFVADGVHTKKLCSRLSFRRKRPCCVFEPNLGA